MANLEYRGKRLVRVVCSINRDGSVCSMDRGVVVRGQDVNTVLWADDEAHVDDVKPGSNVTSCFRFRLKTLSRKAADLRAVFDDWAAAWVEEVGPLADVGVSNG